MTVRLWISALVETDVVFDAVVGDDVSALDASADEIFALEVAAAGIVEFICAATEGSLDAAAGSVEFWSESAINEIFTLL